LIVPLPDGQQAVLWDVKKLPVGRRNVLLEAFAEMADDLDRHPEPAEGERPPAAVMLRWLSLSAVAVRVFVRSWGVCDEEGRVLPTPWEEPGALDELPSDAFDALAAAATPLIKAMRPAADPKSGAPSTTPATPG